MAPPKAEQSSWPRALASRTTRLADNLNDRFVSLAGRVDELIGKTERAVTQKITGTTESPERPVEEDLARWARIRLSDLHLRVGQSIYQLDRSSNSESAAIRRQLLALLDEIERLEEVLLHAEPNANAQEFVEEDRMSAELDANPESPKEKKP